MTPKTETAAKIRVLIVDDVQQTRTDIRRLLYFEEDMEVCGEAANGREALDCLDRCLPDVVLMDINMPVLDGISATEALVRSHPHISVVIISIQGEQEYLRKAMLAGARDYLVKPLSSEEMASTIRQVYHIARERNQSRPPFAAPLQQEGESRARAAYRVITFFSGKGGSGKTFLAGNLAVALAKEGLKVALLDLDLQFGDVAVMLNLSGTRTIADLAAEGEQFDTARLKEHLIHHLSGVSVLAAPASPPEAEKVGLEQVEQVLGSLKEAYDCVLIDTPASFSDLTLLALERSDLILLPVCRDIATIKNARAGLEVLNSLGLGEKVQVILNQASLDPGIELAELEQGLGCRIAHRVAFDEKAVLASINRGVPLVMEQANHEIARELCQLARKVCHGFREKEESPARKMSLGKLFSLSFG